LKLAHLLEIARQRSATDPAVVVWTSSSYKVVDIIVAEEPEKETAATSLTLPTRSPPSVGRAALSCIRPSIANHVPWPVWHLAASEVGYITELVISSTAIARTIILIFFY
jgi:hypothetical protein